MVQECPAHPETWELLALLAVPESPVSPEHRELADSDVPDPPARRGLPAPLDHQEVLEIQEIQGPTGMPVLLVLREHRATPAWTDSRARLASQAGRARTQLTVPVLLARDPTSSATVIASDVSVSDFVTAIALDFASTQPTVLVLHFFCSQ